MEQINLNKWWIFHLFIYTYLHHILQCFHRFALFLHVFVIKLLPSCIESSKPFRTELRILASTFVSCIFLSSLDCDRCRSCVADDETTIRFGLRSGELSSDAFLVRLSSSTSLVTLSGDDERGKAEKFDRWSTVSPFMSSITYSVKTHKSYNV